MTTTPTNPFQPVLDIALDAVADIASGLLNSSDRPTTSPDPVSRILKGIGLSLGIDLGADPEKPAAKKATASAPSRDGFGHFVDDVRSPDPADRFANDPRRPAQPAHAPGVHVGADLKVTALPDKCANLDCSNRSAEGDFVMVETGEKVVSRTADRDGFRGIRLWMCSPCATALTAETAR